MFLGIRVFVGLVIVFHFMAVMEGAPRLPRGVWDGPGMLDDPWEEGWEMLAGAASEGFG